MSTLTSEHSVPSYVEPDRVVDFDFFLDPGLLRDVHMGYKRLHEYPQDILYTWRNGGHWIVTRFDTQTTILRDTEHFSNRELDIPASHSPYVMIPLNLDPPDHARYRAVLMRHFDKKAVAAMEPRLRMWANRMIDQVIDVGKCDFSESIGAGFPVSVFMEMMGLPLERFEEYRKVVLEFFSKTTTARRIEIQSMMVVHMTELFEQRRLEPKEDLASHLLAAKVRDQPLTLPELQSIGFLLFIAGLDTVANALTFAFRQLAEHPELQAALAADATKIPDFVEESLRRYSIVNQTRVVKKDVEINGASFRVGDMVVCPLSLAGMDDWKNPRPEAFEVDRTDRSHISFSTGPHICIGNILARNEMRVFTEEWLKRVPSMRVVPNTKFEFRGGGVMALMHLPLEWTPPGKRAAA
jgi:cytochrome P450